jgi:hypothetical protein
MTEDDRPLFKFWEKAFFVISYATIFIAIAIGFYCASCTTSVTTIYSNGDGQDSVDEDQKASPNISPTLR